MESNCLRRILVLCFLSLAHLHLTGADDVILSGDPNKSPVVLIVVQGEAFDNTQYVQFSKIAQQNMANSLWVGIPSVIADSPNPITFGDAIIRVLKEMSYVGLPHSKPIPLFIAAHSFSGRLLQEFTLIPENINELKTLKFDLQAEILLGSFIKRENRISGTRYPFPVLTVAGELDGVCWITRIGESYLTQAKFPWWNETATPNLLDFPIVVVEGMNHARFATGKPPLWVQELDLRSEINETFAAQVLGEIIAQYMETILANDEKNSYLDSLVSFSGQFLDPIAQSFLMEGTYHLLPPCEDNPVTPNCYKGSPWTALAQELLAGAIQQEDYPLLIANATLFVQDTFHVAYEVFPYHHPFIQQPCAADESNCILNITTVTQNIYADGDSADLGIGPIAATEMRAKMVSRQAVLQAAAFYAPDLNATDGGNLCGLINQFSWDYANEELFTLTKTRTRFSDFGENLVIGDDWGPYNGFDWIFYPLQYTQVTAPNGTIYTEIHSPMMRIATDYIIPIFRGMHYCKLLSPARAMEWIYVDGLKLHYSWNDDN